MTKVYPNATSSPATTKKPVDAGEEVVLTVWRRSLLFNGKGFTVFDAKGNLVFRVDNYACRNRGEVVLMDASGKPLLTIKRKKLSLSDSWFICDGDATTTTTTTPRFSVRRHVSLFPSKSLAHVTPACNTPNGAGVSCYDVEGSYMQRSLTVCEHGHGLDGGEERRQVAAVRRKEAAFGPDVFRLVVGPGFDAALAMAVVVLLDQMHAS